MYEKFKTEVTNLISDKLYFNDKYFIKKTVVSTFLYIPFFGKVMYFEFCLAKLIEEGHLITTEWTNSIPTGFEPVTLESELEEYIDNGPAWAIEKRDLTEELNKYCPNPEKQKYYIYKTLCHRGNMYNEFFTFLDQDSYVNLHNYNTYDYSLNKQNFDEYDNLIENSFKFLIYDKKISHSTYNDYNNFIDTMNDFWQSDCSNQKLTVLQLREIDNLIDSFSREPLLYYFTKNIMDSFYNKVLPENIFFRCQHCGQIKHYAKDKKYCSLKIDGKDCAKKVRNKRNYQNRKLKLLNK